jgi:3-hydroxymyristoyl/3-hydroxydecanoyl-(acyl carrier protein) dehydratase
VLLEIALQPCGWLAAYLGSALASDQDLHFRNLGGTAVQHRTIEPGGGPLTTDVHLTRVSQSGGMIIQNFDFAVHQSGRPVYDGQTYFGFFTPQSLADQVGLPGKRRIDFPNIPADRPFPMPDRPPLPAGMIRMMDEVTMMEPGGGPAGLGAIRGRKTVDPDEWFFAAHFYQDPVWPGSLGLEALIQLVEVLAVRRWNLGPEVRFTTAAPGASHEWVYRGQVVPANREVTVEAAITRADDRARRLTADGLLIADGVVIYDMKGFSVVAE